MKEINDVYINDIVVAIPFKSYDEQRNIVSDLYNKRNRGYIIKGIEVDDPSKIVIYREPNKCCN